MKVKPSDCAAEIAARLVGTGQPDSRDGLIVRTPLRTLFSRGPLVGVVPRVEQIEE